VSEHNAKVGDMQSAESEGKCPVATVGPRNHPTAGLVVGMRRLRMRRVRPLRRAAGGALLKQHALPDDQRTLPYR
jgi:hypothetical protein